MIFIQLGSWVHYPREIIWHFFHYLCHFGSSDGVKVYVCALRALPLLVLVICNAYLKYVHNIVFLNFFFAKLFFFLDLEMAGIEF